MNGYITIHRQLLDWEWWDDAATTRLWIYLLLAANWEDKKWHGMTISRGQLVTSLATISERTGLSIQQIRTCLDRLKSTNEITTKSTNKFTVVTICKYDDYQIETTGEQQANQQAEQQSINNQSTTTEKEKNIKKESISKDIDKKEREENAAGKPATLKIEDRKTEFINRLTPYVQTYGRDTLNEFFRYWTETNPNGRKMRFEMEKVFDVARRLATWRARENNRKPASQGNDQRMFFDSSVQEYTDGTI